MGKRDRRSSLKMNRRTAQAKKKERIKRHRAAKKAGTPAPVVAKKTRASKAPSNPPADSSS